MRNATYNGYPMQTKSCKRCSESFKLGEKMFSQESTVLIGIILNVGRNYYIEYHHSK